VLTLPKFVRREAVAVCGESFNDGLEGVRRVEPVLRVEVLLDALNLRIKRLGYEEVGAINEVF